LIKSLKVFLAFIEDIMNLSHDSLEMKIDNLDIKSLIEDKRTPWFSFSALFDVAEERNQQTHFSVLVLGRMISTLDDILNYILSLAEAGEIPTPSSFFIHHFQRLITHYQSYTDSGFKSALGLSFVNQIRTLVQDFPNTVQSIERSFSNSYGEHITPQVLAAAKVIHTAINSAYEISKVRNEIQPRRHGHRRVR
jgi:hypothetical protein